MSAAIRLLIVAADPLARTSLAAMLSTQESILIAGQADAGDELDQVCAVYRPDVLLWDAGWDGAASLLAFDTPVETLPPILAIAANDSVAALWATGVRGVVGRSVKADVLATAVAAVASGLGVFDPTPNEEGVWSPPVQKHGSNEMPIEALTPREVDVLNAMADGLSNKLIARALEISEHTVKYHVNSILSKLDAQSRTDAVVRATRAGILHL